MTNPYYGPSGAPSAQTRGVSAAIRAEFQAVGSGFDAVNAAVAALAAVGSNTTQVQLTSLTGQTPVKTIRSRVNNLEFLNSASSAVLLSLTDAGAATFLGTVTSPSFIGPLTGNVTGNVSGSAGSVSGIVGLANGGTGVAAGNAAAALTALGGAPLVSPALTGTPTVPTAPPGTATTQAASTGFVMNAITNTPSAVTSVAGRSGAVTLAVLDVAGAAPLISPVFSGTPALTTTPATSDDSTALASTAFVKAVAAGQASLASPAFTGVPTAPTPATSDASTALATTQYVTQKVAAATAGVSTVNGRPGAVNLTLSDIPGAAPLASPTFTGTVTAPTFSGALSGNATSATTASNATSFGGQPPSAYQAALNYTPANLTGANSYSQVQRMSVGALIGAGDTYIYDSGTGYLSFRTGTAGAYKYSGFGANGDLNIQGNFYATGALNAGGVTTISRNDTGAEGGKLFLNRASDNAAANYWQTYGGSTNPTMRYVSPSGDVFHIDSVGNTTAVGTVTAAAFTTTGTMTAPVIGAGSGIAPGGDKLSIQSSSAAMTTMRWYQSGVKEWAMGMTAGGVDLRIFENSGTGNAQFTFGQGGNFTATGQISATQFNGPLNGNASNTSSVSNAVGNTYTWTGAQNFNSGINTAYQSGAGALVVFGAANTGASMVFLRSGQYGLNMGLDNDNVFRIGGFSAASNRFQMDMTGNLTMAGNITGTSDERLKKDWATLPTDFVEGLAALKSGSYTRIDSGERQVGVSAQSLQAVLPEAVSEDMSGTLSVAYGNAALVAVIELSKRVLQLEAQIEGLTHA
jgi:hypothetical protein